MSLLVSTIYYLVTDCTPHPAQPTLSPTDAPMVKLHLDTGPISTKPPPALPRPIFVLLFPFFGLPPTSSHWAQLLRCWSPSKALLQLCQLWPAACQVSTTHGNGNATESPGGLVKTQVSGSTHRVLILGQRIFNCNKFPGDTDTRGPGTTL